MGSCWLITSPISGESVVLSTNLIAPKDENELPVYTLVDPIEVGFLTIPTWANLVSVGKSLSLSSNRA